MPHSDHASRALPALAILVCGLFWAAPAPGHEFWLMPASYRPRAGDTLAVSAWVGTGFRGEAKTFSPGRCAGFSLLDHAPRSLASLAVDADSVWARIPVTGGVGVLIAYVSTFAVLELDGEAFDRYLELEGLREPLEERRRQNADTPGRERYRRCPKTWVGQGGHNWSRVVGQPLEIVPLSDPGRPGPLRVRILADGAPAGARLVRAWRQPFRAGSVPLSPAGRDSVPPAVEAWTDARGEARFDLQERGEWLLSVVRMVRSAQPGTDWESTWASLTFGRP